MIVKLKKIHPSVPTPCYAKAGDAGMDLTAISRELFTSDDCADYVEYDTGISVEIPSGYVGLVFPRSSNTKVDMTLGNSVGIIDSTYRGSIKLRYKIDGTYESVELSEIYEREAHCYNNNGDAFMQLIHKVGDRVGQLIIIPYPQIEWEVVNELSETERGEKGFGSTNK